MEGVSGYKWNTVNDYLTSTNIGSANTKTETGLACNTIYTRYLWAFNACVNSGPVVLRYATSACSGSPVCGQPIAINHTAGPVAAVNKPVSYGTVVNIPGETGKCWITQNLGSDHQATSASDATEASAG